MPSTPLEQRQEEMRARMVNVKNKGVSQSPATPGIQTVTEPPKIATELRRFGTVESTETTISRKNLYELACSEPMVKVAVRFGVSDVAVAKACRRHDIPVPGLGYWARVA